ncbi:hypothetical protein [Saccharothrix carnea]|nr:hypothetical protein [Saccharothrix sp. CB00851]
MIINGKFDGAISAHTPTGTSYCSVSGNDIDRTAGRAATSTAW